jgi:hypothetical protein
MGQDKLLGTILEVHDFQDLTLNYVIVQPALKQTTIIISNGATRRKVNISFSNSLHWTVMCVVSFLLQNDYKSEPHFTHLDNDSNCD